VAQWDEHASGYDRMTALLERRVMVHSRAWVARRATGRVLEVAVGTGANLAHYPADLELTAVDWSAAMLDQARAKAAAQGREVTLLRADATDLPFAAGEFDTVVCTFGLCCIPDEPGALVEMARVLAPGGRLLLADHVAAHWPLRALQHAADLVTVRTHGEHWTRRPRHTLERLAVPVIEAHRWALGAVEQVHAAPGATVHS